MNSVPSSGGRFKLVSTTQQNTPNADGHEGTLERGGGGPYDPGMEARLRAVETGLQHVETRVGVLETKIDGMDNRLRAVEVAIGTIGGKLDLLVGKIPSWWQPPVSAAGMLALLLAAIAAAHYFKILG